MLWPAGAAAILSRRAFLGAVGGAAAAVVVGTGSATLLLSRRARAQTVVRTVRALGTQVRLVLRHPDRIQAVRAASAALGQIFLAHETLTRFEPSPLTQLNAAGFHRPVPVPKLLFDAVARAHEVTRRTEGLFDVTIGGLMAFLAEKEGRRGDTFEEVLAGVGSHHVVLHRSPGAISLLHPKTALDLNGIAKGYGVDMAASALLAHGISDFLVNAGGDIYAHGHAGGEETGWPVGLASPEPSAPPLMRLWLRGQAVATSGNTFRPKRRDGSMQRHLVDPRQGQRPQRLQSATIIAPQAAQADAWATAAYLGGVTTTRRLLKSAAELQGYVVTADRALVRL